MVWFVGGLILLGIIIMIITIIRVKPNPRLTLLMIVLLVICTFIFLFLGNRNSSYRMMQIDLEVPTARQLRSFFSIKYSPQEVRLARGAESGCLVEGKQITVPIEATCAFFLKAAPNRTKQLSVKLEEGSDSVDLTLAQENALTIEQTLQSEETSEILDVYRNEAEPDAVLTITNCHLSEQEDEETGDEDAIPIVCILEINP